MSEPAPRRVLAISSGGGHWIQLRRLRPAFETSHTVWATVEPGHRDEVGGAPFHVVSDATRWTRWKLALCALQVLWLVIRVRPHVVVTTGAAPGLLAVFFGKLLGARTAWIDSIANADELSGSGRLIRRFADLWLTQWPHLARDEGPHYAGAVL